MGHYDMCFYCQVDVIIQGPRPNPPTAVHTSVESSSSVITFCIHTSHTTIVYCYPESPESFCRIYFGILYTHATSVHLYGGFAMKNQKNRIISSAAAKANGDFGAFRGLMHFKESAFGETIWIFDEPVIVCFGLLAGRWRILCRIFVDKRPGRFHVMPSWIIN